MILLFCMYNYHTNIYIYLYNYIIHTNTIYWYTYNSMNKYDQSMVSPARL